MRIVLITESFSKQMGYMENCLPTYFAKLGAEVHVIATDLPPYHQLPEYQTIFGDFTGTERLIPGTVEEFNGFTLHIVPHRKQLGYARLIGLKEKLISLRPDIVQTKSAVGWIPLDAAHAKKRGGYVLFTANHTSESVFPLATRRAFPWDPELIKCRITRTIPGIYTSRFIARCVCPTDDCVDIAVRFMGVPRDKTDMCPLGVETDLFYPVRTAEDRDRRAALRAEWGVAEDEIVCIYTGKLMESKDPAILAAAVEELRATGEPYRAVFYGNGPERDRVASFPNSVVRPFVPYRELPDKYRAADLAVWPTQITTSMLDAAACGLPLVVHDELIARERIDGNGITFRLNDREDLKRVLLELKPAEVRKAMGAIGAERMLQLYSWDCIARRRLADYERALAAERSRR